MSVRFIFSPGDAQEFILDKSQIISHNPVWEHTGMGDLRASVEETNALNEYAQRKDRVNVEINGSVEWTGYLYDVSHNRRTGNTEISAYGIAWRLEETRPDYDALGGPLTYNQIALEDAIRDYWSRTPFTNYTVTDQTTTLVADDEEIQRGDSATSYSNITNISNTTPLGIDTFGNGNLNLLQTAFWTEAEDASGIFTTISNADAGGGWDFSGGNGALLDDELDNVNGNHTLNYRVPDDEPYIYYRIAYNNFEGDVVVEIDTTEVERDSYTNQDTTSLDWEIGLDALLSGYDPGTYNVEIRVENYVSGEVLVDGWVFYDGRYYDPVDFDDATNEFSALDSPQLYKPQEVLFNEETTSYNIDNASIFTNLVNTTDPDELAVTFDGGSTWNTTTGTSAHTFANTGASRQVRGRVTLGNYTNDPTTSPATGDAGQELNVYTLDVDLNNLVVIDELDLSRNHFDNLQTLHDYGNFHWTIEHGSESIGNIPVNSYWEGDETRTSPSEWDNPENIQAEVRAENYFNSVYLEGAKDETGDRPVAEVKDTDAIANDGREIQVFLRDLNISTEAGATFRAQSLLNSALENGELIGTLIGPPNIVYPGYSYLVDFGEGENYKTLERVQLSESKEQLDAQYDFVVESGFGEDISRLKRNARELSNQV